MRKRTIAVLAALLTALSLCRFSLAAGNALPASYSSAALGYTGGVNDQGDESVCWAFTQNELLTVNVAKKSGTHLDFSENAMMEDTSNTVNPLHGYMRNVNGGGNEFISTAYLARGGAVVEGESERRGYLSAAPMASFGVNTRNEYKSDAVDKIKSLIYTYGAVGSAVYAAHNYEDADKENYYYDGFSNSADHSVTIVGWDDDYPKSKFRHTPSTDGAFIVKNTWGNYHKNGTTDLVYVSYCDRFITETVFASDYEMENGLFDNVYQYDHMGWAQNFGYSNNKTLYGVSRFVARTSGETLTAVSTYLTSMDTSVSVLLSYDLKTYTEIYNGEFTDGGYVNIPIKNVKLRSNVYYIAIKYTVKSGDCAVAVQSTVRALIENAMSIEDNCFIGKELSSLRTLKSECDRLNAYFVNSDLMIKKPSLCIKAFTKSGASSDYSNLSAFTDLKNTWYTDGVSYAVGGGLFSGMSKTQFLPNGNMTRAMFVTVLANVANVDLSGYNGNTVFDDVKKTAWYAKAVQWANESGIVSGVTSAEFAPNANVTRQQMCVMLVNFSNYINLYLVSGDKTPFADGDKIQSYAEEAVYTCRSSGIVSGVGGNRFDPRSNATRAQVAVLFANFCRNFIY